MHAYNMCIYRPIFVILQLITDYDCINLYSKMLSRCLTLPNNMIIIVIKALQTWAEYLRLHICILSSTSSFVAWFRNAMHSAPLTRLVGTKFLAHRHPSRGQVESGPSLYQTLRLCNILIWYAPYWMRKLTVPYRPSKGNGI